MFFKLLLLFLIIPIVELAILIRLGNIIGVIYTILLVGFTGVVGVSLAKIQGVMVISRVKIQLMRGKVPADNLLGGLLILIGGIMLLTPGLLTDITGFSLILPGTRNLGVKFLKRKLKQFAKKNVENFYFNYGSDNTDKNEREAGKKDYIDVDFEENKDESGNG